MFGLGWHPAHATVVQRRIDAKSFDRSSGESYSAYEYMVDVHPDDGSPTFRATLKDPFNMISWHQPNVGDTVQVKFHGDDRKVKWDRDDPNLHEDSATQRGRKAVADAHTPEAERRWSALASAAPGAVETHDVSAERAAAAAAPKRTASPEYTAMAEAIRRAKAAGDQAEVERLKAEFKHRATTAEPPDIIEAIIQARAAGNQAEADRLSAEFKRRAAESL